MYHDLSDREGDREESNDAEPRRLARRSRAGAGAWPKFAPMVRSADELGPSLSALSRISRRVSEGAEDLCVALTPQSDANDAQEFYIQLSWLLERLAALEELKSRVEGLLESTLLAWFATNDAGVQSFEIGSGADATLVWPTVERKTKLRGAGKGDTVAEQRAATRNAARKALESVLAMLGADQPAELSEILEPYLSTGAVKPGSCKDLLGRHWDSVFEVLEPERLASGEPKKRLGETHKRFLKKHRKE